MGNPSGNTRESLRSTESGQIPLQPFDPEIKNISWEKLQTLVCEVKELVQRVYEAVDPEGKGVIQPPWYPCKNTSPGGEKVPFLWYQPDPTETKSSYNEPIISQWTRYFAFSLLAEREPYFFLRREQLLKGAEESFSATACSFDDSGNGIAYFHAIQDENALFYGNGSPEADKKRLELSDRVTTIGRSEEVSLCGGERGMRNFLRYLY